jgi:multifunctional methyltransferase subunit TRM112
VLRERCWRGAVREVPVTKTGLSIAFCFTKKFYLWLIYFLFAPSVYLLTHVTTFESTMRLITHNMLQCNAKGVTNGYPLRIECSKSEVIESDFNEEVSRAMLAKIDWSCLKSAIQDLALPLLEGMDQAPAAISEIDTETLKVLHHVLFEVHVIEGELVCPESGRKFPVQDGIPNMLLHEDEV